MHDELDGRDDVVILAFNSGNDSQSKVEEYWDDAGFDFDAVLDLPGRAGANSRALGVRAYPTNVVVGPDGKVKYSAIGFDEATLRQHLGL